MNKFAKVMIGGVVIGGLLAGCGGNQDVVSSSNSNEEPKAAEQKDVTNKEEKTDSGEDVTKDENGNVVLETVGQTIEDENGKLELLKINQVNEVIDLSPVKMAVKDIKVFKRTDIPQSLADELNSMYDKNIDPKEGFVYLQIGADVENTEEKNVEWNGINKIVTDTGQQIDGMFDDFIYDNNELGTEMMGAVKGKYYGGYLLNEADINKVKMVLSPVYDSESYDVITEEQQVEYTF